MKKIIGIISLLTLISAVSAQTVSVDTIIYQDGSAAANTQNMQTILPNNIAFETVKLHLRLASITSDINPEEDSLATLKQLQELTQTNIIEWLSMATDKQQMLSDYLSQSNIVLEKWDMLISFIKQELALLQLDMKACLVDKTIADKAYFDSVNSYDQSGSQQAIQTSIANDTCAAENRIQLNAKTYLLNKIVFFTSVLQQKYNLLFKEQDTLISHFNVISDTMLQKLNTINETLKSYQF